MSTEMTERELAKMAGEFEHRRVAAVLTEAIEAGHVSPQDFSLRRLYGECCGYEALELLNPRHGASQESYAVNTSAFTHITGAIVSARVMQGYRKPSFVLSPLIPNVPTSMLDGERIPGLSDVSDHVDDVGEGQEYPRAGFGEDYIETPATKKKGLRIDATSEAVFADKTGRVLRQAASVGEVLGLNKEKRLVDLVIGATNNYKRKGTAVDTYQSSTPWINTHTNVLVDWTDIDAVTQLFANMTDPNTGEPIELDTVHMLCTPGNIATAKMILGATEVQTGDGASGTAATRTMNPVAGAVDRLMKSTLMYSRTVSVNGVAAGNAAKHWYAGDFTKAFGYMEVFPIRVEQAPDSHPQRFDRDILASWKASERGVAVVMDPRYVVQNLH